MSLGRRWGNTVNEGLTAKRLQSGRPERAGRCGRKLHAIYADPPWAFEVYSGKGKQRSAEREKLDRMQRAERPVRR